MPEVIAIQFTQDQMRTLTGVPVETMRHWRKAIPYLAPKTGKAARFSFADLLGLAVTNELVNSFGVHITTVSAGVDALFRLLAASGAASLEDTIVLITASDTVLREVGPDNIGQITARPSFVIPLAPLIIKLQQQMLPVLPISNQAVLPFPPEVVRSRA